jgi:hypothetical protein
MRRLLVASALLFFLHCQVANGQSAGLSKTEFFKDTSTLDVNITTGLNRLFKQKENEGYQYTANFSTKLPDGTTVDEPILLEVRGHFRKDYCYIPPLRIIFKAEKNSVLNPLGSLKLVSKCKLTPADEQYLLKEYVTYKIYNLLTDMSFRVRLLNINWIDSEDRAKKVTEHAFLMEDIKDLAERNNCIDAKDMRPTEATNRRQMTIVALFQYMIGNTDWSVAVNHNIRLIQSKIDSLHKPYAVPYDFDYAGLVNTDYAVPDERLGTESVKERVYRGFPRTMGELNDVLDMFRNQKDSMYALINNFDLLNGRSKKEMCSYLDEFFDLIKNQEKVNEVFIQQARLQ